MSIASVVLVSSCSVCGEFQICLSCDSDLQNVLGLKRFVYSELNLDVPSPSCRFHFMLHTVTRSSYETYSS